MVLTPVESPSPWSLVSSIYLSVVVLHTARVQRAGGRWRLSVVRDLRVFSYIDRGGAHAIVTPAHLLLII